MLHLPDRRASRLASGFALRLVCAQLCTCGCRCRSTWQRHPPRYMARALCLMERWRGRGIQHRCCNLLELHALGYCNKPVTCEPSDHHLRQIGTGWSLDIRQACCCATSMMFCHLVIELRRYPPVVFPASTSSPEGAHFRVHWGWDTPCAHERNPHGIEGLSNSSQRVILIRISNCSATVKCDLAQGRWRHDTARAARRTAQ